MLVKFTYGGKGGGGAIAAYLTDPERQGRDHAPPEVVRGEMDRNRKWTYSHGVVSFALEDAPSEDQQREVMDEFERLAFAGMDPEQYDITWVRHQHTEGGRVELHFVTPRMELTTGKALNIAPPGWESTYGPLRDAFNYSYGWARPDDPERARELHRAPERALEGFRLRKDREALHGFLTELVAAGKVRNRSEMIRALEGAGLPVPRAGKNYLTVQEPESGQRFRLKGRIYEKDWSYDTELDRALAGPAGERTDGDRGIDRERAAQACRELETRIERRSAFHADRYRRHAQPDQGRDRDNQEIHALVVGRPDYNLADDRRLLRLALDEPERDQSLPDVQLRGTDLSAGSRRDGSSDLHECGRERENPVRSSADKEIAHGAIDPVRARLARTVREVGTRIGSFIEAVSSRSGSLVAVVREHWRAREQDRAAAEEFDRALRRFGNCLDRADERNISLARCRQQVNARTKEITRERGRGMDYGR